jgi:hypothetical protein
MELVLSTPYIKVHHYKDLNILYAEWSEMAGEMSQEDFKQQIITFVSKVKECEVKGFLVNSRQGHFTMGIDTQEWHEIEVVPKYLECKLEKIGFILPEKDFFAAVSLQQTFDETEARKLQTHFFDDLENAWAWIK